MNDVYQALSGSSVETHASRFAPTPNTDVDRTLVLDSVLSCCSRPCPIHPTCAEKYRYRVMYHTRPTAPVGQRLTNPMSSLFGLQSATASARARPSGSVLVAAWRSK